MELTLFEDGIFALGFIFLVLPFVGAAAVGYSRHRRRELVATSVLHALLMRSAGNPLEATTREFARSAIKVADTLIEELRA